MPVIEVHLSASTFKQLGKYNRDVLGNEWRMAVHGIVGEPLESIAVFWQPFADAQNPLQGLELWVFFGVEGRDHTAILVTALLKHFKRVIRETALLPDGTDVGVWLLPQPDSDFGMWKVGSTPDKEE